VRNTGNWIPTKYVQTEAGLKASRDPKRVAVESRLIADLAAANYDCALRQHASGELLDLGCGNVPLFGSYRSRVTKSVCADWWNTLHKNDHLDVVVDLTEKLPFADCSFDTVLLTDVLEHVAEPMQLMGEMARVMRLGGKVIIGVPFLYWPHEEPHDYYRYTRFALQRFCDESRLRVLELYAYGGLPEVMIDLASKGLGAMPAAIAWLKKPVQAIGGAICRSRAGRKLSKSTAEQIPLGYILVAQKA
jgi:SAM-dependent methyltransferase